MTALKVVVGTNPAANVEFSETVPAGKWWKLMGVSVQLAQGVTQTPRPILVLDDGASVFYESFGSTGNQAVSTTARYNWGPLLDLSALTGTTPDIHATAPLPEFLLGPGFRVRSVTLGKGAASDYGAPSLFVVEYDDNPFGADMRGMR